MAKTVLVDVYESSGDSYSFYMDLKGWKQLKIYMKDLINTWDGTFYIAWKVRNAWNYRPRMTRDFYGCIRPDGFDVIGNRRAGKTMVFRLEPERAGCCE